MTDENPAPDPTGFLRDYDEKQRAYQTLSESLHAANKTALFDALASAGITSVLVRFDGSGDSGQTEEIDAVAGDWPRDFPPGTIPISRAYWGAAEAERSECNVRDAVETLAYALLEETHGGWENNEGAYGEFTFAVTARTITLDYNERIETSEFTQHVF